ncbi:MAG TPA: hypothetical protein VMN39_11420, partial [Longimicrobiaceae bacterium]|nr:hypothetical protein [Longimicrobiaceae bacterium]
MPNRRQIWGLLVPLALGPVAGCDYPLGIGRAWVDGEWIYEAGSVGAGSVTCEVTGVTLSFDQEGSRFAGIAASGTLACSTEDGLVTRSLNGAPVTAGRVDGRRVRFDIGAGLLRHDGRVDGRSITGTVTIRS